VKLVDVCPSNVMHIKGKDIQGNPVAVEALIQMLSAALDDGIGEWQISAGYRSYRYQQQLMDEKVSSLMNTNDLSRAKAQQAARKTVAPAGCSEHHTGLAFDITVAGVTFAGTEQHQWLAAHCHEYGFILRYQAHKEALTGYLAEAWHYRYVGVGPAAVMVEHDWCLEEYVESGRQ
jgi:D-alanyl-D-alanine carboxypeptidase